MVGHLFLKRFDTFDEYYELFGMCNAGKSHYCMANITQNPLANL